jgi:hypothetical protein
MEFKSNTRSQGNFYKEKNSLCLLFYTAWIIIAGHEIGQPDIRGYEVV